MEEQNQRGFFGIVISKEILDDQELTISEKFIYGYIASFTKCCFESNEKIASKLGVSESTVKHAIPKLAEKGFLFIEKVNNRRMIYSVLDNPKKLAYLVKKGMIKPVENSKSEVQNLHTKVQNLHTTETGVESAKFAHIEYRIKKNKAETEQEPNNKTAGSAVSGPASRLTLKREDFDSESDYEKEFYNRNTIKLGAV